MSNTPINFDQFPVKQVSIYSENCGGEMTVLISTESANNALFGPDGQYVSAEAKKFDESIYFYVPDNMIDDSDSELRAFIEENCC